ncbi:tetratricopeptide repeat protein [Candidatus Poribacteria bacterium]|nr:tetratricopeptide repeat protein [Candidatus Poribacteria bacterium]
MLNEFLQDFDQAIQEKDPLKILNHPIQPEFLQLLRLETLEAFHRMLEGYSPTLRRTLHQNPSIQKIQAEIVRRYLIRIPRDFSPLRLFLEEHFPDDRLTQALDELNQAVAAETDWIRQDKAFLSKLREIRGRGSRFDEVIAIILSAFPKKADANKALTHVAFVRHGAPDSLEAQYMSPAIFRQIATVGNPAEGAIFPNSKIGPEFERTANAVQLELQGDGQLEARIEYEFVDALIYWNQFYGEGKSAGLAFAFLAYMYQNPRYRVLAPYLACFGSCDGNMITRVGETRYKVMAAKERGIRVLVLPKDNVHEVSDLIDGCEVIEYDGDHPAEVVKCIAKKTKRLLPPEPNWIKMLLFSLAIVLIVLWSAIIRSNPPDPPPFPPGTYGILVSYFVSKAVYGKKDVPQAIKEELQLHFDLKKCSIEIYPKIIKDKRQAEQVGKKCNASLVLWGSVIAPDENEKLIYPRITVTATDGQYVPVGPLGRVLFVSIADLVIKLKLLIDELKQLSTVVIGLLNYQQGDYQSAVNRFTLVIQESKDNEDTPEKKENLSAMFFYRGTSHFAQAEYSKAISDYLQAIDLNDNAASHCNLGAAYIYEGKYGDAISPLKTAIALKPDLGEAYINLSSTYNNRGKYSESIKILEKARQLKVVGWFGC